MPVAHATGLRCAGLPALTNCATSKCVSEVPTGSLRGPLAQWGARQGLLSGGILGGVLSGIDAAPQASAVFGSILPEHRKRVSSAQIVCAELDHALTTLFAPELFGPLHPEIQLLDRRLHVTARDGQPQFAV